VDCSHHARTTDLSVLLAGCPQGEKIGKAKEWLRESRETCPDGGDFWLLIFQLVSPQIEAGKPITIFNDNSVNVTNNNGGLSLRGLIIIGFYGLAALAIIGGIYAIYKSATGVTEFDMYVVKLTTSHVAVALIGIGLVTAYFTTTAVLKEPPKPRV